MISDSKIKVAAIVAMSEDRVIGAQGKLPWHIPEDMRRFKKLTSGCAVIMGRKTYESLPPQFRPLPARRNLVVTRNPEAYSRESGIECFSSPEGAIEACKAEPKEFNPPIWIIGGAEIYGATVHLWDEVYLTLVHKNITGDVCFPRFEENFDLVENTSLDGFSFQRYVRKE